MYSRIIPRLQKDLNRFEWDRTIAIQAELRFLCTMAIALLASIGWLGSTDGYSEAFGMLGSQEGTPVANAGIDASSPPSDEPSSAPWAGLTRPVDILKSVVWFISPLAFSVLGLVVMVQFIARCAMNWNYLFLPDIMSYRKEWEDVREAGTLIDLGEGHTEEAIQAVHVMHADLNFLGNFCEDQATMISKNSATNTKRWALLSKATSSLLFSVLSLSLAFLHQVVGLQSAVLFSWIGAAACGYLAHLHYRRSSGSQKDAAKRAEGLKFADRRSRNT